ncbi:phosphoserine phosphatase SerB [Rhodobaculum claviforme]|uniref:Phosphoserine phosphatase n=1 Tax=Rhodobaculum claviforme TaxID=1549854 RepID=A0A934WHM5_9RHOB|nr:phosphoserine phosphatase SerB [Rhodobaculum claviforme]MBK5925996.1 phosphoserine phosphatase SerB [Rhodobaculum claviforme]
MYVATLITAPAGSGLPTATVDALRARWSGGPVRWLAEDLAAEIPLADPPADAADQWAALQAQGIDLAVQPAANRRKRLLLADMDSTMIEQECIDELAVVAGIGPQIAAVTARAMNGELEFESALRERVALLAGLDAAVIAEVLAERITYTPGGRALVATMKAHGATCVLVSGGFTAFTGAVAAHLGFDAHRANLLEVADGRLSGSVAEPILGRAAKREALEELCARHALTPADVLAIGDGANDLDMLEAAGMGIAMHAKPAVAARARLRIHHGDLTAALYLQGYARADFAA